MFTGSIVALVTPMTGDGEIDWEALAQLVEFHIQEDTDAIVAVGTTGESATLDWEEHGQVIRYVIQCAAGRIPVIAGTGANSTKEAIELTAEAKEMEADACLLVTPYYNKPTQEGLYQHYRAIARAVDIPQILYNVPGRTACDLLPETVARLTDFDNIIALKEATGDLSRVTRIKELCGDRLKLYSGDDATAAEFILAGGSGDISVTANVVPKAMHQLCQLALEGKSEEALALNNELMPLHQKLFIEPSPIPVKWALWRMGLIEPGIRLPMTPLSSDSQPIVEAALTSAGVSLPTQ